MEKGVWKVNQKVANNLTGGNYSKLANYALHYVRRLNKVGKFALIVWPYHSMLGGIGHALVSAVEEALFFHCIARNSQTQYQIKGQNPLTENYNYSVLNPEILEDEKGISIAEKNTGLIKYLLEFDVVIIAGQAKSYCVAWNISDLLTGIEALYQSLARKVYLLQDCTSSVVVPGAVDYTEQANSAFHNSANAGINLLKSIDEINSWF